MKRLSWMSRFESVLGHRSFWPVPLLRVRQLSAAFPPDLTTQGYCAMCVLEGKAV